MKSELAPSFREMFAKLPQDIQRQARAAYRLFKRDPFHPSLRFKRVMPDEPVYSARIGRKYRVMGLRDENDVITWFWVGSHAEYDKWLK